MNVKPPSSPPPSSIIGSYRKRNRSRQNIINIAAAVLVLGGLAVLIYWLSQPGKPINLLFATETPTPTVTLTPTNTVTPSPTFTETSTPTITPTATFSAPFTYTVQDGDSLAVIAEKFVLGDDAIPLILLLNPFNPETGLGIDPTTQIVIPGQVILLPNPDMQLPTATSVPPDLPRGTLIEYTVQSGDSLAVIADIFNSTIEAIIEENNIDNPNALFVGQILQIPVNLVTPTATRPPTSTPQTPGPGTFLPTSTTTPINAAPGVTGTP
ncbi:MAG: LysM peptidoglycan-binding domain-containing protein [Anaerolineales bacterium]|nr:MAG: LysM peptidoglycan-binding domain-containing protein [Chloroflexota bacterium]MBE7434937.1 LysM peptidoglycan-binding domain-containing protein [Anaerolineales bacterium]MCE7859983.1 LysM peptidoglycan-binding domain-containing protein [Chloroflexi bacterium CFX2]MCK6583597.1 LysM peptidoglycan-binding domain-containing protein [Anaerolineales bacterium]